MAQADAGRARRRLVRSYLAAPGQGERCTFVVDQAGTLSPPQSWQPPWWGLWSSFMAHSTSLSSAHRCLLARNTCVHVRAGQAHRDSPPP